MRHGLAILAAFSSLTLATTASASSMMNARIIALVPNNAGVLQINVEGVRTALPACANSSVTWNVNVNTPAGQMLASALLTAFAQNLPVDITGISSCEFSGVESIGIIGVHR